MTISEVRRMRTNLTFSDNDVIPHTIDESMFRCWAILVQVKRYLKKGCPSDILLELIEEMEDG